MRFGLKGRSIALCMLLLLGTAFSTCFPTYVVWGDKITLKNGGILVGIIEQQDDSQITLRTDAGAVVLPRNIIVGIEPTERGQTHIEIGNSLFQAGQLDKAEAEYRMALSEPGSAEGPHPLNPPQPANDR